MDAILARSVLSLIADIVVPSSLDDEVLDKVESVRRLLNTESTAPIDIQQVVILGTDIGDRLRDLEAEKAALAARLLEVSGPQPVDGYYRMDQFLAHLAARRGHTYAIRIDYVTATQTTPGVQPVRNEDMTAWQRDGRVPAYAYEQVERLIWPVRKNRKNQYWTNLELEALCQFYREDTSRTNIDLANLLTARFGRDFTEQTVRAQLHRQRVKDKVSKFRRPRPEAA